MHIILNVQVSRLLCSNVWPTNVFLFQIDLSIELASGMMCVRVEHCNSLISTCKRTSRGNSGKWSATEKPFITKAAIQSHVWGKGRYFAFTYMTPGMSFRYSLCFNTHNVVLDKLNNSKYLFVVQLISKIAFRQIVQL